MTRAEREEKMAQAVELSAKGKSYTAIASALGVSWVTAKKLVADELAIRAEERTEEREAAIAVYRAIIKAAWERFEATDNRSLNATGYLNTIRSAQERIDKLSGSEAPAKSHQTVDVNVNDGISAEDLALLDAVEEFKRANPSEVSPAG